MMRIFIDTEFTDFFNCHLISLGIVSEYGEEFYCEVPYPDEACSTFVHEVVVPLLSQNPHEKCSKCDLKIRVLNWLRLVRPNSQIQIQVCYDYQTDWDLFIDVLDGEVPLFIRPYLINTEISDLLLYDFWKNNPDLHEHHALHDARANAYSFREPMTKY